MPSHELAINEKDKGAKKFCDEDFRRYWVSDDPFSPRNADARVKSNQSDNGFEHPSLAEMPPAQITNIIPPNFKMSTEEQDQYLSLVHNKLALTRTFLKKEKELNLSPHRPRLHKEDIAITLAEPPIRITFQAQLFTRLLLDTDAELRRLNDEARKDECDALLDQPDLPMRDYPLFWDNLKASLVWQIPGLHEVEKAGRVETVMDEVFDKFTVGKRGLTLLYKSFLPSTMHLMFSSNPLLLTYRNLTLLRPGSRQTTLL